MHDVLLLQCNCKFDPPLVLQLRYAQKSGSDKGDDNGGNKGENAFPDIFSVGECVHTDAIECTDHAAPDDEGDNHTESHADPDLLDELLVDKTVALRAKGLPQPREKYRDDDDCLEAFSKDDEEDYTVG